ncbi:BMP-2-inducible protein kinase-like [Anopheles stephensi]|uniref:BMP-2-inducible protein kinase-like n=1 Tax=Anopheles stephensi TaxID=30069 RepID=UPI0007D38F33|nr:BMP-2-inducible protein kinase-like [Anopheles stephensi]
MVYKVEITLLVCAFATVLSVVHSAPNPLSGDIASPQGHGDPLSATYLPPNSLTKHSNEPERLVPPNVHAANENPQNQRPRTKRALIFRPLFVYRQQEIKKQKLKEMREQKQRQQQMQQQQQQQQSAASAACQQHHHATRKPVRYYAQAYPYQRWY